MLWYFLLGASLFGGVLVLPGRVMMTLLSRELILMGVVLVLVMEIGLTGGSIVLVLLVVCPPMSSRIMG